MVKSNRITKKAPAKEEIDKVKASDEVAYKSLLPMVFVIVGFLIFWFIPESQVQDPWYEASSYLDSAQKTNDPVKQKQYLEISGNMLRGLVHKHPYHARVRFFMGLYYYKSKLFDSANIQFNEAIRLDSGGWMNAIAPSATKFLISSVCNVSTNYLKENKLSEAKSALDEIAMYLGINPDLNFQMGLIFQKSGNADSSIAYYESTLRIDPKYTAARNNLGIIFIALGNKDLKLNNFDSALNYFLKAINIGVRRVDILNNVGQIYYKKGDFKSAIKFFEQAFKIDQNYAMALRNLIQAHRSSGDQATADALASHYRNLLENSKVQ